MSEIKLKPCPFCGGKGSLQHTNYSNGYRCAIQDSFFIICVNCHATSGKIMLIDAMYKKEYKAEFEKAELEAARLWNWRVNDV